ncbi:MAG: hypothetical protein WD512_04500 [Candidatus Paceibacterota bacterium]
MTEAQLKRQRDYRKKDNNKVTHRYEKTKNGFLMRLYRNMKSRVTGIQKAKYYLYKGKSLLSKSSFYDWAKNSKEFHDLFEIWEQSGYNQKLTPSVDRIDSSLGYTLVNMQWLTHSENSLKGNIAKNSK